MDLAELAEQGVKRALAAGADAAEVFVSRSRGVRVAAAGRYASPGLRADDGVAVRVVLGGRTGGAGVQSFSGLDRAVHEAIAAAGRPSAPAAVPFPAPQAARHADGAQAEVDDAAGEGALDLVDAYMQEALARREVSYCQAELKRSSRDLVVANSSGALVRERSTGATLEVELRVSDGRSHRTTRDMVAEEEGLRATRPAAFVDRLVRQASAALDHRPLPGTVDEIILEPVPAAQLLRLLSSGFSGVALQGGKSALGADAAPLSPLVTLVDDPRGRRIFDDEGVPTRLHPLVDAGRIVGHLHDSRSAASAGIDATGHAQRSGILGGVAPRPWRLRLSPGSASLDELVEGAERAVLVTDPLVGSFVSDKVTSRFSVVAPFAFYVEGGRIRHALPPTTIGGSALDVFRHVRALGRDVRECSASALPPIHAGGVTCAT